MVSGDRDGAESQEEEPPVLDVEVERLEPEPEEADSRWGRAIGPVVAGMIIDVLDLATIGGIGLYLGFLLGVPAGWYLARHLGLDRKRSALVALGCGIYCSVPITSPIPFATLIGVWARARQSA